MAKKKVTIEDPERVLMFGIALAHPLRIRVLTAHARIGAASATMLSDRGLGSLGNVSYHQVKLRELGALTLVGSRPKQGAIERRYDLSDFGHEVVRTAVAIGRTR